MMRRKHISVGLAGIFLLAALGLSLAASTHEQQYEIYLAHAYKVGEVELKPGMYVVVHKQGKDKAGAPCTFFYRDLGFAIDRRLSPDPSSAATASESHRETILSQDPRKSKFSMAILPFRIAPLAAASPAAQAHCYPTKGPLANAFTLDSELQSDGNWRIRSIQFAGSTDVHQLESGPARH
jgi:hypothetical protein